MVKYNQFAYTCVMLVNLFHLKQAIFTLRATSVTANSIYFYFCVVFFYFILLLYICIRVF